MQLDSLLNSANGAASAAALPLLLPSQLRSPARQYRALRTPDAPGERLHRAMQLVTETAASRSCDEFFESLVCNLVEATRAKAAMVTEIVPGNDLEVTTRALWYQDRLRENITYQVDGTPCQDVFRKQQQIIYTSGVRDRFPQSEMLIELKAESFLAVPFFGSEGQILGHLVIIDNLPMRDATFQVSICDLFAVRAGVELERCRAMETLEHRVELEKLLANISTRFINVNAAQLDDEIDFVLKMIGALCNVDRSYVLTFSEDMSRMTNTHEWCEPGIDPRKEHMIDVALSKSDALVSGMNGVRVSHIPDVSAMPDSEQPLREELKCWGIRSLLEVPIQSGSRLYGVLGFHRCRTSQEWAKDDIRILRMVAEIFGIAMDRRRMEEELQHAQSQLLHAEKMAALGQLTAGIAHEVNTPAGVLRSSGDTSVRCVSRLETLLADEAKNLPAPLANEIGKLTNILARNLSTMRDAEGRIGEMVLTLKQYSLVDQASRQQIPVRDMLATVVSLLRHNPGAPASLESDYNDRAPISCDAADLQQAFMNLLVHLSDLSSDGGRIQLKTREKANTVEVEIASDSADVPAANVQRQFEIRFDRHGSRVQADMRLFGAAQIVGKHGGRIEILAKKERFAGLQIILPLSHQN